MKKISCTFLFFLTLAYCSIAQRQNIIKCDCKQDKVKLYYDNVYQAEKFIIQGNFDSSLYYYTNARLLIPMMPTDILNSNILLKKPLDDRFIYYCFFNVFKILPDSVTKESYLERIGSFVLPEIISRLDTTLINSEKINWPKNPNANKISIALDSLNNLNTNGGAMWNNGQYKKGKSSRKKLNRDIMNCLMNLYKQYGSINFVQFHGHEYGNCNKILLYNFYDRKTQEKYSNFFENEVRCGNMNNRTYESTVDDYLFDSTQVYGYHSIFFVGDTLIVYQLSDEGQNRINENRRRIFLQDIETTHKKLIWQWLHYDEFMFSTVREIIPYDSSQTAKVLAEDHLKKMGSMVTGYTFYTH